MSTFIKLRLILQEPRPDLANFLAILEREKVEKGDLDLLLRKAVESKLQQFSDFANALIRKGANVNFYDSKDHVSNLMLACEKGTCAMVENLLCYKELCLLHKDMRQLHAGFYAVQNKSREDSEGILKLLVQREPAIVNQQAGNQTMLIAAIRKGKVEIVKLLLDFGANPNWQVPDTGNSSLHDAVKQFKTKFSKVTAEIIRLLLLKGGDSLVKNNQSKTVYDYAQKALADYQKIEDSVREQLQQEEQKVYVVYRLNEQREEMGILLQAEKLFKLYEEENEEEPSFLDQNQIYSTITKEILEFQAECIAEYDIAQRQMKGFLSKLDKLCQPEGLNVEIIGSFATGLWIRQSNIDIQLTRLGPFESIISPKQIIQKLVEPLKRIQTCKSINLVARGGRMSVIRMELGEGYRARVVHISVADRNQASRSMVNFIKEQMSLYRLLSPMFFVLKTLCYYFRLSDPKSGGLRTYALVIMLLSFIVKWNTSDLGKLLVDFLFYFGFYYDYFYERKEDGDPLEELSLSLQIIDPLNHANDLAKYVRASDLQRMFRAAYIALHSNVSSCDRLQVMFDMKKIML